MRCYANINAVPLNLVSGLGSNIVVETLNAKRRDAGKIELQLFEGEQGAAAAVQLAADLEMRFKCQAVGDFGGGSAVFSADFAWDGTAKVYRATPSFGSHALSAMFGGATQARRHADAYTLTADDLGGSVTIVSATAGTVIVPPALGSGAEKMWIIAADAQIVITAGSGVTLTTSVSATVPAGGMVMIERTALNAWTIKTALDNELESVSLEGEFTWRSAALPDDWTSTETFTVVVSNDVNQGDEAAPIDADAPTIFATKTEVASDLADLEAIVDTKAADADLTALESTVSTLDSDLTALDAVVATKATTSALNALSAEAVKITAQSFTATQQAIARNNIGAGPSFAVRFALRWNAQGGQTTGTADGFTPSVTGIGTAVVPSPAFPWLVATSSTTDVITCTAFTGADGDAVMVLATGTYPSPLVPGTWYYVRDLSGFNFKLAATPGGAAIDITSNPSLLLYVAKTATTIGPQMRRVSFLSSSSAGSSCGLRDTIPQFQVSSSMAAGRFVFSARWMASDPSAVANARCFIGMVNTGSAIGNVNPSTLTHMVGIGADTGDANLQIMHNDGSGTATKVNLGSNFPANSLSADAYEAFFTVANDGASIAYAVRNLCTGNTASGTISTDLPAAEKVLAPQLWRNNGTTALAASIDIMQFAVLTLD